MAAVEDLAQAVLPHCAAAVLDVDLPGLAGHVRADAIDFVVHRVLTMPSIPRLGVVTIATVLTPLLRTPVRVPAVRLIARANPPLVGDFLRLVRGLLVSRVWETHPDTVATVGAA